MMKWAFAAMTVAAMCVQSDVQAHSGRTAEMVDGWYHRYLGRCADDCGLRSWSQQLRCGKSPDYVLSCILGSDEYYQRQKCCDTQFVKALYKDHLGRCASAGEVREWVCQLRKCGSRQKLAYNFLCAAKQELSGW